jgi:pimeloyl-ACP methyl ester carboxylesterase
MLDSDNVVAHKKSTPEIHHSVTELGRAVGEFFLLGMVWPLLGNNNGGHSGGDGHPVLVLPGFLGSDVSTSVCRRYLRQQGFKALPWQLGSNTGRASIQAELLERFLSVSDEHEGPISLVGHSLGGVFARELARQFPDRVRAVVTLGSPFGTHHGGSVAGIVRTTFERVSQRSVDELREALQTADPREPPGVPSTAIYSRADGVVHWRSCLEQDTHQTENIEVLGSHIGMIVNPSALVAIADRLAQPHGGWRKFRARSTVPGVYYPS